MVEINPEAMYARQLSAADVFKRLPALQKLLVRFIGMLIFWARLRVGESGWTQDEGSVSGKRKDTSGDSLQTVF
jgi:hypothetical protein